MTGNRVAVVGQLLALGAEALVGIARLPHEDCPDSCELMGYGFEIPEGMTETEANLREFEVKRPEDALNPRWLSGLAVDEDDGEIGLGVVMFDAPWESHGANIAVHEGRVVGYTD